MKLEIKQYVDALLNISYKEWKVVRGIVERSFERKRIQAESELRLYPDDVDNRDRYLI